MRAIVHFIYDPHAPSETRNLLISATTSTMEDWRRQREIRKEWGPDSPREPSCNPEKWYYCVSCQPSIRYLGQYMVSVRGERFYEHVCKLCWRNANPGKSLPTDDQ